MGQDEFAVACDRAQGLTAAHDLAASGGPRHAPMTGHDVAIGGASAAAPRSATMLPLSQL